MGTSIGSGGVTFPDASVQATAYSSDVNAISLTSSGYIKFKNGLILQWGFNSSSSAGVTVTFPVSFPTACLGVNATASNASGYDTENIQVRSLTTTNFILQMQNKTTPAYWMAWGY